MTTTNLDGTDNRSRDGLNTTAEPDRTAPPAGPAHATVAGRRCGSWPSVQAQLTVAGLVAATMLLGRCKPRSVLEHVPGRGVPGRCTTAPKCVTPTSQPTGGTHER
jgi:hypothetical protein